MYIASAAAFFVVGVYMRQKRRLENEARGGGEELPEVAWDPVIQNYVPTQPNDDFLIDAKNS
jgi:hypothetical protein